MVDAKKEIYWIKKKFLYCFTLHSIFFYFNILFYLGDENRKRGCGSFFFLYNK